MQQRSTFWLKLITASLLTASAAAATNQQSNATQAPKTATLAPQTTLATTQASSSIHQKQRQQAASNSSNNYHEGATSVVVADSINHSPNATETLSNQQHSNKHRLKLLPINRPNTYKNVSLVSTINGSKYSVNAKDNDNEDYCQDTLRQVAILHRHGDRTVVDFAPKDPVQNESFWFVHGLGQLTNRGKQRLYLLGSLMRERYGQFLENSINKNRRITRSSGSPRCIESAQVFLSSFLALDAKPTPSDADVLAWDNNSSIKLGAMWQPASILTTSSSIDGMLAENSVCKKLNAEYKDLNETPAAKALLVDYKEVVDVLNEHYGFKIDAFYKWFWASSFIEVERSYFESKLPPKILAIYDKLQEAGNKAFVIYQSTPTARRLRAGLLINDIVEQMDAMRSGHKQAKQILHYSGHDLTNVALLGVLGSFEHHNSRPDYASTIMFELHHDKRQKNSDDHWFVQAFYMPRVPGEIHQLKLKECVKNGQNRCTLSAFKKSVESYRIPSWFQWMQECQNDMSQVNPYKL